MRIPDSPFGQVIPRAVPQPGRAPLPATFRSPIGDAIENLGRVGMGIAGDMMGDALRAKQEQDRLIAEQERQAKAERAAADKAQALNQLSGGQDRLADLHDEIAAGLQTGQIPKSEAEKTYRERASKILADQLATVPEQHRETIGRQLDSRAATLENGVRRAVTKRDQQDTHAGLLSYLETIERTAATDPTALDAGLAAVDQLGPFAGMATDQQQKLKQTLKERVTLNRATMLLNNAKQSPAGLDAVAAQINSDAFADLDPQRKTALLDQIDVRKLRLQQQGEIAASRAAREAERRLGVASRAVEGLSTLIDRGVLPDDGYLAQVQAAVAGTPFEATVPQLVRNGAEVGGFATQPVAVMDAEINRLRNESQAKGSNPAREKSIERLQRIRDAAVKDYKDDPLTAARDRGVLPALEPLTLTDIASLPQQLATRVQQAQTVRQVAGQPVSPLTDAEANALGTRIATLPPDQKSQWLAAIGGMLPERDMVVGLARQIDKRDKLLATALMYADTKTTQGRYVSEIILRGEQATKDGRVKVDQAKETGWRAAIASQIGDAYLDQELRGRMIDAAVAIQTGLASEGGGNLDRAVRLATGGIRVQGDGSRIPLPYGWTERDFRDRLKAYPAERLPEEAMAGGVPVGREQLVRQLGDAVLIHAGQGKYVIRAGSGFVTDRNGVRVLLDFN